MSVDGIGRGGRPPKIEGGQVGELKRSGAAFNVPSGSTQVQSTSATSEATLLEQVRDGSLNLDAYLEQRVGEAVQHLKGSVSAEQMEFIERELRAQLKDDPVLVDLVRRATGRREESDEA